MDNEIDTPPEDGNDRFVEASTEPFTRRHGRLLVLIVIGIMAVGITLMQRQRWTLREGADHPLVGMPMPSFELQPWQADEPPLTSESLKGRVTLINFWGPWCPPCRLEMPHLVEIYQDFRDRDEFQLITVSCEGRPSQSIEDLKRNTAAALSDLKTRPPVYFDEQQAVRQALVQLGLPDFVYPTTLIVGPDLKIRALWRGYTPGLEVEQRQVLEQVLP